MYGYGFDSVFKNISSGGASYDPDAQTYFDSIGDVPTYAKVAISNRIIAFKANSVWTGMNLFLPFPPTKTMFGGLRDAKTNAVDGTQVYTTANAVNPSANYEFPRALNGLNGMNFWGGGAFQTGLNTSTLTSNDSAWAAIYQDADVLTGGYNHGVFGGGSNSYLFQKNTASAKTVRTDGYTGSLGTGRVDFTSVINGGVYIANVDTDLEIWEDGVSKGTKASTGGSLPSLDILLNGYRTGATNGVGANNTLGAVCYYGAALTDGEIAQETTDWQTFQTEMKRTGTYDFSMMLDGNSQTVRWNTSLFRNMCFNLSGLAEIYTSQIGIWGTEFDAMIAGQTANLFPKVQSSYGKLYMVVWEGTNEIGSGTTATNTLAKLETYCANLKANALSKSVSIEIIVPTLLNRVFAGDDTAVLESGLFNVGLIAGDAGSVDHVIQLEDPLTSYRADYASDALFITAVRAFANAAPFTDGTHLENSVDGYPVVSALITDYIKTQEGL